MQARDLIPKNRQPSFNQLRRGHAYRATTRRGITVGEYLGMESPHGERALLLRTYCGTASIPLRVITAIQPAA